MLRGEDDYKDYFEDTMRAGHYENNERAVDLMIRSSNDIIRDLVFRKVDFPHPEGPMKAVIAPSRIFMLMSFSA